jgi:transposase
MISRKPHPTDISDEEWALVVPYLALLSKAASQRAYLLREVFNTPRYVMRNGIP